jgi:hypothetical protein
MAGRLVDLVNAWAAVDPLIENLDPSSIPSVMMRVHGSKKADGARGECPGHVHGARVVRDEAGRPFEKSQEPAQREFTG